MIELNRIYTESCLETLARMPDNFVDCCITSPPYWGLRDYGHDSQIGLEKTPEEYVSKMVEVFRDVRRVLKDEGTLWLNLGDTYYNFRGYSDYQTKQTIAKHEGHKMNVPSGKRNYKQDDLKGKDLVGIPWMVAFALRADGWYLRSDIIWSKPNPMPESVTDRPTKAHEYVFLMSKNAKYYYDADAIKEGFVDDRMGNPGGGGQYAVDAFKLLGTQKGLAKGKWNENGTALGRNKRTVFQIPTSYSTLKHDLNPEQKEYVLGELIKRGLV